MDTQTPQPSSPKQLEQPNPKKLKMSTTTSDDEEHCPTTALDGADKKPRYKRRKIAIFFAYCGVGYQGMQKNPGAKTIEGDLEEALYQAGAVPDQDRGQPRKYDWARSARTDKGVSAVGQVVSGRFYVDPPGFIERLNSYLPDQFLIFGYKRVTGSFNAKKFCDRRRYVYLVPVFALDPNCHRDRESVMASVGSGNELVKCVECSERGRKVFGVMGKSSKYDSEMVDSNVSSNNVDAINSENKEENVISVETDAKEITKVENDSGISLNNVDALEVENNEESIDNDGSNNVEKLENGVREGKLEGENDNGETKGDQVKVDEEKSKFCYGEKEKERFNRILKYYEGTHNCHNFTTRTKAEDPSAIRYIISFTANTVVTVDGIDFVKCEVVGQSFMLHQIRKMIGLAVAVVRNIAPESLIETAFSKDVNITVPMAPEVGLYLDECFFSSYNQKWKSSHEEVSMKAYAEEAEAFKMKYIYPHIASTEHKDGVVALWLHSLNYRNYPDLRVASVDGSDGSKVEVKDESDGIKVEVKDVAQ